MDRFFEIIGLRALCPFILQDNSRIDLRSGIPDRAPEIYKMGFDHLGLKPGAEKFFKNESEEAILKLVARAKRIEDLEVLGKIRPKNSKIKNAIDARILEFDPSKKKESPSDGDVAEDNE